MARLAPGQDKSTEGRWSTVREAFEEAINRYSRQRATWPFLAWLFVMTHSFDRYYTLDARAAEGLEDESEAEAKSAASSTEAAYGDIPSSEALGISDEDTGTGDGLREFAGPAHAPIPGGSTGAETSADARPFGQGLHTHAELNLDGSAAGLHGARGGAGSGGGSGSPVDTGPNPLDLPAPALEFFNGFDSFFDQVSSGTSPGLLIQGLGDAGLPLQFAFDLINSPTAPLSLWQGLGDAPANLFMRVRDGVDVDWVVQANGAGSNGRTQFEKKVDGAAFSTDQTVDTEQKATGNTATLVDGSDWNGMLMVKGNYFEFNTIVQINVLFDNDNIEHKTLIAPLAPEEALAGAVPPPAPDVTVHSGQNEQSNDARILDIEGEGAAASNRMAGNGEIEHFGVFQVSNIVDMDQIRLDIGGEHKGPGSSPDLSDSSSINGSGHTQSNNSVILSGDDLAPRPLQTVTMPKPPTDMAFRLVDGDFYEFNTIFQLNLVYDNDTATRTSGPGNGTSSGSGAGSGAGPGSGPSGGEPVSTGHSKLANTATIIQNDNGDALFVAGAYSEYHLVLQINVLVDNDTISLIRQIDQSIADSLSTMTGPSGVQGASGGTINMSAAPSFEELAMRQPTIDSYF